MKFTRIGTLAAEVVATVSSKKELKEATGKVLGVIASDSPGRGYKLNETTVGLRRSKVGRIADAVEGSSPSIKGAFAPSLRPPEGRNGGR